MPENNNSLSGRLMCGLARTSLLPFSWIRRQRFQSVYLDECLKLVVRNGAPYSGACCGSRDSYQRPAEAFTSRWEKVSGALHDYGARNLLDVGCAEGYMLQKSARECGVFAMGLEMDWQRIRVGNAERDLKRDRDYGIIPMKVDSDSLRALPMFDAVICFSVLHHVIRHKGMVEARAFLKSIASVTGKCFLFDMCSPEETANDPEWGNVLEFIKGDVPGKTGEFLEDAGFRNVRHIGDTPGFVATENRPLFLCEPPAR